MASPPNDSPPPAARRVCPRCGEQYDANARFCARDGEVLRDEGAEHDWLVGSLVGDRYIVERKLGEGGMGVVYLAEHRRMHRKCALKVLRPEALGIPDAVNRFVREAENASRISHPNIATIYDCAEASDELMYIAMEYIDGERLSDVLNREGTLAPARATHILLQVAAALRAAHELGIVHRDLKPDNIMLAATTQGREVVKVVDFGIARAVMKESQRITVSGVAVGTPAFMSPEQLSGDASDSRTDQFALALVMYLMLTGALPFPGSGPEIVARFNMAPKSLAELHPGVDWPERTQTALNRALSVDKEARFPSIQQFARGIFDSLRENFPDEFNALVDEADLSSTGSMPSIGTQTPGRLLTPIEPRAAYTDKSPVPEPPSVIRPEPSKLGVWIAAIAGVSAVLATLLIVRDSPSKTGAIGMSAAGGGSTIDGRASDSASSKDTTKLARPIVKPMGTPNGAPWSADRRVGRGGAESASGGATPAATGVAPAGGAARTTADTSSEPPQLQTDTVTQPSPPPTPTFGVVTIGYGGEGSAILLVNGDVWGSLSRVTDVRTPLGAVRLRLQQEGCQSWDTTVTVSPDAKVKIGRRRPKC